jgi:hypothetical protein
VGECPHFFYFETRFLLTRLSSFCLLGVGWWGVFHFYVGHVVRFVERWSVGNVKWGEQVAENEVNDRYLFVG